MPLVDEAERETRRNSSCSAVRMSESEFCTYVAGSHAETVYTDFPRSVEIFPLPFDCLT